jgi:hypothetical protein
MIDTCLRREVKSMCQTMYPFMSLVRFSNNTEINEKRRWTSTLQQLSGARKLGSAVGCILYEFEIVRYKKILIRSHFVRKAGNRVCLKTVRRIIWIMRVLNCSGSSEMHPHIKSHCTVLAAAFWQRSVWCHLLTFLLVSSGSWL